MAPARLSVDMYFGFESAPLDCFRNEEVTAGKVLLRIGREIKERLILVDKGKLAEICQKVGG